jgi:hypothetical protein
LSINAVIASHRRIPIPFADKLQLKYPGGFRPIAVAIGQAWVVDVLNTGCGRRADQPVTSDVAIAAVFAGMALYPREGVYVRTVLSQPQRGWALLSFFKARKRRRGRARTA